MESNLAFVITAVIGVIGWFVTLERRMNSKLSIEKHEKICEVTNARIEKRLDDIHTSIEERDDRAGMFRDEIRGTLHNLSIRLEVISTQQRLHIK